MAKAAASDAAVRSPRRAIQAHGGIGFTWEADVHWLYKRAQMDARPARRRRRAPRAARAHRRRPAGGRRGLAQHRCSSASLRLMAAYPG